MDTNNFFQSNLFKGILLGIAGLGVLVFVFSLGAFVGSKKAEFSFRWADEYHRNFGGPQGGIFGDFMGMDRELPNANGSFGKIIKIDLETKVLTIKGASSVEKNILVSDKTIIVLQKENIKLSDLKVDENIVVMGEPNASGQIEALLIRVMPSIKTGGQQ